MLIIKNYGSPPPGIDDRKRYYVIIELGLIPCMIYVLKIERKKNTCQCVNTKKMHW